MNLNEKKANDNITIVIGTVIGIKPKTEKLTIKIPKTTSTDLVEAPLNLMKIETIIVIAKKIKNVKI